MADKALCIWRDEARTRDKLLFLTAQGIRLPVHGLGTSNFESIGLREAVEPYLSTALIPDAPPRLVRVKPRCRFSLSDAGYKALLGKPTIHGMYIETVQLIEIPGDPECGLLLAGSRGADSYQSGIFDSFVGPHEEPRISAPDPSDVTEVWRQATGKILRLPSAVGGDYGNPTLFPVRDAVTGRRYYVHSGEQYGRGGGRHPFAFEWQYAASGGSLVLASSAGIAEALIEQCVGESACKGIDFQQAPASDRFAPMPLADFIKTHRKDQYQAYLAAVLELDRPRLQQFKKSGVPPDWTADAIAKVSAATLPLADKRKRTAWLFADNTHLASVLPSHAMTALADWLPDEDWQPVLRLISVRTNDQWSCEGGNLLGETISHAESKGRKTLACDLLRAHGRICGSGCSVSR